jgi:hypothetical protein
MATNFDRCLAYLEKCPPAVSNAGGHNATMRAACECVRFGLSDSEMWEALTWFNEHRCSEPWSEKELRHKMESAKKKARFGERTGRYGKTTVKPITAAELAALSASRQAKRPPAPPTPICQRSEAEEDAWWIGVAAERGADLAQWDRHGGRRP